jgi:hypothetical protein
MIRPIRCSETSVKNYHSRLRNIPEQRRSLLLQSSYRQVSLQYSSCVDSRCRHTHTHTHTYMRVYIATCILSTYILQSSCAVRIRRMRRSDDVHRMQIQYMKEMPARVLIISELRTRSCIQTHVTDGNLLQSLRCSLDHRSTRLQVGDVSPVH